MTNEKLEVLVVDDREENLATARTYFSTRQDLAATYATTYEGALEKLSSNLYEIGIFDVEIPRRGGMLPEKLGEDLVEKKDRSQCPFWANLTAGIGHYSKNQAKIRYANQKHGGIDGYHFLQASKNEERCWKEVIELLDLNSPENQTILNALRRAKDWRMKSYVKAEASAESKTKFQGGKTNG